MGRRWTGAILRVLMDGPLRFSEIAQAVPELSDRLLSERMKELEARGIVERTVIPGPPLRVEYELSRWAASSSRRCPSSSGGPALAAGHRAATVRRLSAARSAERRRAGGSTRRAVQRQRRSLQAQRAVMAIPEPRVERRLAATGRICASSTTRMPVRRRSSCRGRSTPPRRRASRTIDGDRLVGLGPRRRRRSPALVQQLCRRSSRADDHLSWLPGVDAAALPRPYADGRRRRARPGPGRAFA